MHAVLTMLLASKSGVTAIEYALVAGIVGIAAVAVLRTIGTQVNTQIFSAVAGGL
jgi:Flp pilus assembly pilin Flp